MPLQRLQEFKRHAVSTGEVLNLCFMYVVFALDVCEIPSQSCSGIASLAPYHSPDSLASTSIDQNFSAYSPCGLSWSYRVLPPMSLESPKFGKGKERMTHASSSTSRYVRSELFIHDDENGREKQRRNFEWTKNNAAYSIKKDHHSSFTNSPCGSLMASLESLIFRLCSLLPIHIRAYTRGNPFHSQGPRHLGFFFGNYIVPPFLPYDHHTQSLAFLAQMFFIIEKWLLLTTNVHLPEILPKNSFYPVITYIYSTSVVLPKNMSSDICIYLPSGLQISTAASSFSGTSPSSGAGAGCT